MSDPFAKVRSVDDLLPQAPTPQESAGGKVNLFASRPGEDPFGSVRSVDDLLPKPEAPVEEKFKPVFGTTVDAAVLGLANGLLQNFGAEAAGVIGGLLEGLGREEGFSAARERVTGEAEQMLSQVQKERPVAFGAGEVAGAIGTTVAPGAAVLRSSQGLNLAREGLTRTGQGAKMLAQGGAIGGAQGAVFGAGEDGSLTDRAKTAATGTVVGALSGVVGTKVGSLIGRNVNRVLSKVTGQEVPTAKGLQAASQQLFRKAEKAGKPMSQRQMRLIVQGIEKSAQDMGAASGRAANRARLNLASFVKESDKLLQGGRVSPEKIDMVRRELTKAIRGKGVENETRIIGELTKQFDDNVARWIGKAAARDYTAARKLWRESQTLKLFEPILEKYVTLSRQKGASKGIETFRDNLRSTFIENKTNLQRLSPIQQRAIQEVVEGAPLQRLIQGAGGQGGDTGLAAIPWIGPILAAGARGTNKRMMSNRISKASRLVPGQRLASPKTGRAAAAAGRSGVTSAGITRAPITELTVTGDDVRRNRGLRP